MSDKQTWIALIFKWALWSLLIAMICGGRPWRFPVSPGELADLLIQPAATRYSP